jgi:hypothetical protein
VAGIWVGADSDRSRALSLVIDFISSSAAEAVRFDLLATAPG